MRIKFLVIEVQLRGPLVNLVTGSKGAMDFSQARKGLVMVK